MTEATSWVILTDAPFPPYVWSDGIFWDDDGLWNEDMQWLDLSTGDPTDEV